MRWIRILVVALAVLLAFGVASAYAMPKTDIPLDGSDMLKGLPAPHQLSKAEAKAALTALGEPYTHEGRDPDLVLTMYDWDPLHGGQHIVPFWKEGSGAHSDVYVGWNDLTPPPTSPQQNHLLTPAQLQYMADEFDTRIWASDVFHFGNYLPRVPADKPGFDGTRASIFVYNIRDEMYWRSFDYYTAGFFWAGLNDEIGLNAIFIDSYDWADRIGADVARPHLYEGTIAHEFQHLIHHDVDGDEDSFIDEGMADMAEQFVYGTEGTASHIGEYLYYHRDSLIDWKGELFDYGNAVLWQDYLWEKAGGGSLYTGDNPLAGRVAAGKDPFGPSASKFTDPGDAFIWNLAHDQANGLASLANQLGGPAALAQTHRDYTLANLLDGKVTEAKWNYRNLVLGGADSDGMSIDDGIAFYESNVNGNMPPTRKNVRRRTVVEPWGAYYRTFGGSEPALTLGFSGKTQDGVSAYSAPTEWYGGLGNMLERKLERVYDGVPANSELSFKTWFDIEEFYDYGYVEATTDGVNWHQLPQTTTLETQAENDLGSSAWSGPGGLTGNSGGWQTATYDLTGYSGTVGIRFRYATDEASNGQGWYIDDVSVAGVVDPIDSPAGWVTDATDGWSFTNGLQHNSWSADVFLPYAKASKSNYEVKPVSLSASGDVVSGSVKLNTQWLKSGKVYGIVSSRPDGVFASEGRLTVLKGK